VQVYPHLDVWNVVEASEKVTIANWCNFAHNNCHHRFKVRPFRCLGNASRERASAAGNPRHVLFDLLFIWQVLVDEVSARQIARH